MKRSQNILITGVSGFVGSHLLEQCFSRFPHATVFGLYRNKQPELKSVIPLVADITNYEQIRTAIISSKPDYIFHLAAQSSVAESWINPLETFRVNTEGVINLFEALRSEQIAPRIIIVGSGEQYGMVKPQDNPINEEYPLRPMNPYAISKTAQDLYSYQWHIAYQLPILRVRPFNHFGPRQKETFVVANFAKKIALIESGKVPPVIHTGDLSICRDFLPVEDVVSAYISISERGQPGEVYNVGSGIALSIEDILHCLLQFTKAPIQIHEDIHHYRRPVDIPLLVADTTKLREKIGWNAIIDFEQALQKTLDYWRANVQAM